MTDQDLRNIAAVRAMYAGDEAEWASIAFAPVDNDVPAALHAALFDAPPEAVQRLAELHARAAVAVDRITGRYSDDVAADWRRVEDCLHRAYCPGMVQGFHAGPAPK